MKETKNHFKAVVGKNSFDRHFGTDRIVLTNLTLNDEPFRDHCWTKFTKRLRNVRYGDVIEFTADKVIYPDSQDVTSTKVGIRSLRNVKILERSEQLLSPPNLRK